MLEQIQSQFFRLISAYETERKERIALQEKLDISVRETGDCRKQIKELETQIDKLRLANAFSAAKPDNSESKREIESLIREIDRCIALLKS